MAVTTPSASPSSASAENCRLVCTSRPTPASAVTRPALNTALGRWRQNSHAASVTKSEARFASSVELATEVKRIDQCQKPRSPAKAKPAASSNRQSARALPCGDTASSGHSSGAASATRQKALAVGPTSETRTKIGESAMQVAPASKAGSAGRMARRMLRLLEVVPALERGFVALTRGFDFLLEDRLAREVVLVRPAAARGAAGALTRKRFGRLVAPRHRLLQGDVRLARVLVCAVELGAAVLRASRGGEGDETDEGEPFHEALSGRIF